MNEKITLPSLVALLSARTSDTKKQTEDFVKEFFASVSDLLATGEQVKIKDIGVFKTVAVDARKSVNVSTGEEYLIPGHRKVVFIPSRELAAEVNEPFEMFETVELSEDFAEEELTDSPIREEPALPEIPEEPVMQEEPDAETAVPAGNPEDNEEFVSAEATEAKVATEANVANIANVATIANIAAETAEGAGVPEEDMAEEHDLLSTATTSRATPPRRRFRFVAGFACGFLLAVAIIAVYAIVNYDQWKKMSHDARTAMQEAVAPAPAETPGKVTAEPEPVKTEEAAAAPADEVEEADDEVPTRPSDQKVYDTITKTRYLTTMAKDHYGNYHLWPYIYKENESFLGHPDRIRPGTKVVIPPLSKYGVNPNDASDIAKAKRMGSEIYARYK